MQAKTWKTIHGMENQDHTLYRCNPLDAALRAAESVASRVAASPVEAAMQVACAFLVAKAQLERASRIGNSPLSDIAAAGLRSATGYEGPSAEDVRAMTLLGLQPLLRMRTVPAEPEPRTDLKGPPTPEVEAEWAKVVAAIGEEKARLVKKATEDLAVQAAIALRALNMSAQSSPVVPHSRWKTVWKRLFG